MVMAGDEEGGLEKHVVELAQGLAQHGHAVTVIAHEKYRARLVPLNFIAVDLSKSRRNLWILYQLYQTLKTLNPDIIHVHGNKAAVMVGGLLPLLKQKSVATLHSRKKNTKMFKNFNAVIAVSPNAAEVLNHPHKYIVLNGIQPPILDAQILKKNPPIVLAVGRLVPVKGFDVLIRAWQGIENAVLWIVGDGFEQEKLQQLIIELQLESSVKLLGFRSDIVELMQQASLYVMSSHYEGCPYTMVEALLCKTPMISTAVGAMTMVLPPQYLCPENDVRALHQLIRSSLDHLDDMQVEFKDTFDFAAQHLVLEGMIQNIETIYNEVLNGK